MEILKAADPSDTRKRIRCVASSSIEDRHGDTITEACIKDMQKQAAGLTIFLNHSYDLPEDVFGFVEAARTKRMTVAEAKDKGLVPETTLSGMGSSDVIAFLQLDVVIDPNERAQRTLASVDNGATIGVSIGAMLEEYEEKEGYDDAWMPPLTINKLELLEASAVGIPANPLSWIEGATKAVAVSKGLLGKRASKNDLEDVLVRSKDKEQPSGAKDDDKAETVPPGNVADGEDMPDAEEEGADEVGEDTPAAADKAAPSGVIPSAASIVEGYRASQHSDDEDAEKLSIKELRVLVQDELHDLKGVRPTSEEVQVLLDAISANRPLEADTTADATPDSTESGDADTDAQEASEEASDPESATGTDPDETDKAIAAALVTLSGQTRELMESALSRISDLTEENKALRTANEVQEDQLRTAAEDVRLAADVVNKVLDLPIGRKSAARAEAQRLSKGLQAAYEGTEIAGLLNS